MKVEPGSTASVKARARVSGKERLAEVVRIEARLLGEREHFAAVRIERHHEAAARVRRRDAVGERLLRLGLHRDVDRQRDVAAGRLVAIETGTEQQLPARVALDGDAARPAEQPLVLLLLDAAHAGAVHVREADEARGERAERIGAPRLLDDADARDPARLQRLDALRGSTQRSM